MVALALKDKPLPSAVRLGTILFFRITGTKPPVIKGYATVKGMELTSLGDAWRKFGVRLGFGSPDQIIRVASCFTGPNQQLTLSSSTFFTPSISAAKRRPRLVMDNPEIKELDLNPVLAYEKGAKTVDARIILE